MNMTVNFYELCNFISERDNKIKELEGVIQKYENVLFEAKYLAELTLGEDYKKDIDDFDSIRWFIARATAKVHDSYGV